MLIDNNVRMPSWILLQVTTVTAIHQEHLTEIHPQLLQLLW